MAKQQPLTTLSTQWLPAPQIQLWCWQCAPYKCLYYYYYYYNFCLHCWQVCVSSSEVNRVSSWSNQALRRRRAATRHSNCTADSAAVTEAASTCCASSTHTNTRTRTQTHTYTHTSYAAQPDTTVLVGRCQLICDASRWLRSSDTFTFAVPRTRTRLGDRSFAVAGPQIWNSLPADLRLVDNYALKGTYVWFRLRRLVTLLFLGAMYKYTYLLTYLHTQIHESIECS